MLWRPIAAAPISPPHREVFPAGDHIVCLWSDGTSRNVSAAGRYLPAADCWEELPVPALAWRTGMAHAWSGGELLLWGGRRRHARDDVDFFATGVRLTGDTFSAMTTTNAPSPRVAAGIWTGEEMIVWGGTAGRALGDGALYRPATDRWRAMSAHGAPAPRWGAARKWNGRELLLWGGRDEHAPDDLGWPYRDGAAYDPAADRWRPLAPRPGGEGGALVASASGAVLVVHGDDDGLEAWQYTAAEDAWRLRSRGASIGTSIATTTTVRGAVFLGSQATVVYHHAGDRWDLGPPLGEPGVHDGALIEAGDTVVLFANLEGASGRGWRLASVT